MNPLVNALHRSPIGVMEERLSQYFASNTTPALVAWLTLISGGTRYALNVALAGRSSSGKTTLVQRVAQLVPRDEVVMASRITAAALFAVPRVRALILDELVSDEAFRSVRRQLVATGHAHQMIATPAGNLRECAIMNPVAIIDVLRSDQPNDFHNLNTQTERFCG